MTEPERLEVGSSRRRPGWLVLLVTVAVLIGLLVVRLGGSDSPRPEAVRPPSSTASTRMSPAAAPTPWPTGRGLPSGTLYVLASDDVYSVDVAGGLVEPLELDHVDPEQAVLTAMAPGILVWSGDGQPKRRLWFAGMTPEQPLGPLRSAVSVLPGSGAAVWTIAEQGGDSTKDAVWVSADDRDATGPQVRVRGFAVPDGAGGLLDVERTRVRHLTQGADGEVVGTYLEATGPDGLVVDSGAAYLCTLELRDRTSSRVTPLGPATPPSPDRRRCRSSVRSSSSSSRRPE